MVREMCRRTDRRSSVYGIAVRGSRANDSTRPDDSQSSAPRAARELDRADRGSRSTHSTATGGHSARVEARILLLRFARSRSRHHLCRRERARAWRGRRP